MSDKATVLYDAPGPRARVRNAIVAVVFIAILVAIFAYVIAVFAGNDQFTAASIVAVIVVASVIGGTLVAAVTAGRIVDPLTDLADRAATMGRAKR